MVVEKYQIHIYYGLLLLLVVLATIISSSYSRDSLYYNLMFERYGTSGWGELGTEIQQREVFLLLATKIFYKLGLGAGFLFFTYAAISTTLKYHLIRKHSKEFLLSLSFFISYFFILLDSTQIRFGAAVAFLYFGLQYLAENRKLQFSAVVIFSAIMFHVASLAFIMLMFFTTKKSLYWLLGMIVFAVILYPFSLSGVALDVVQSLVNNFELQGTFLNKLHRYLVKPSSDVFLSMFGRIALLVYFCAFVIYQYRDKLNPYEMLCYHAFLLSIFFYILLKDIVDLQVRFGDMFGFSLVFLVPYVHRGLSEYIGTKNAYIILWSFFAIHLIKYTLLDKMLVF